jgi:hypothetical protein
MLLRDTGTSQCRQISVISVTDEWVDVSESLSWDGVPQQVREAVQSHIGPVVGAAAITGGNNSGIAARLDRDGRPPVFLKGARVPHQVRFLRNEIAVGELRPDIAPAVLFHEEVDDWLVVGFEYITRRHPSLAPGSPDLESVGRAVDAIGTLPAVAVWPLQDRWANVGSWQSVAERAPDVIEGWDVDEMVRWSSLVAESLEGDRLVHTDLHAGQFVISDSGQVHVIDWGWGSVGAPWVDISLMVLRLILAGHSAESAEQWARARSAWTGLDEQTITAFAVFTAGFWTYRAVDRTGWDRLARVARDYAAWRLNSVAGLGDRARAAVQR